jgi:hypothetical protein
LTADRGTRTRREGRQTDTGRVPELRRRLPAGPGPAPEGVGGGLVGGVVAEADPDRLVVAALLLVHEVGEYPPVGVGRLAAQRQGARVEPPGQ